MSLYQTIFGAVARLPAAPTWRVVRPWALGTPILVLLISLPLLRPLRHPDPQLMSQSEQSLLASVQAVVESHTFAIDKTYFGPTWRHLQVKGRHYSDQSPVFALLLSGPYWVLHRLGITFEHNALMVMFFLTLIGATAPVALAAGLIYKMGRLFELRRPLRAVLALAVVIGSGLLSYSTVLNPHAPAAALLLAAAGCLFQGAVLNNARKSAPWLVLAGMCAALSATIDPPAIIFTAALVLVVAVFRWSTPARLAAIGLYAAGVAIPIWLHASLNRPITGDLLPGTMHPELMVIGNSAIGGSVGVVAIDDDEDEPSKAARTLERLVLAFVGPHGILTHFPIVLLGILGVSMVMHRHWPATTKMLASVTLGGGLSIIVIYAMINSDWRDAMFANQWFVVFLPLTVFWIGPWLRRPHRPRSWAIAGVAMGYSALVTIVGATDPLPREGYDHYTALAATQRLLAPAPHAAPTTMFAGR